MDYNSDCIELYIDSFPASYYRLALAERPNVPTPKRQHETVEVMNRLGALHQHYSYDDMEIDLHFNYLEEVLDFKSFKQQMSNVRHWLHNGAKLELSDEPEIYYLMKHVEISDIVNDIIEYGEFTAKVTLAPFGRVHEDAPLTLTADSNKHIATYIYNDSIEDSLPLIILNGTGDITLSINNKTFNVKDVKNPLYIDSQLKLVYEMLNGVPNDVPQKALSFEFPELQPEINQIEVTGATSIQIYRNMMR